MAKLEMSIVPSFGVFTEVKLSIRIFAREFNKTHPFSRFSIHLYLSACAVKAIEYILSLEQFTLMEICK